MTGPCRPRLRPAAPRRPVGTPAPLLLVALLAGCVDPVPTSPVTTPDLQLATAEAVQVTDLGTLPGGGHSQARGVNDAGDVVGWASDAAGATRAVLWRDGVIQDLGTLGGPHAAARDVNESGAVVGWSHTGALAVRGFLWQGGAMTELPPLPGGSATEAFGINDAGLVAGWSMDHQNRRRAVVWAGGGVPVDIGAALDLLVDDDPATRQSSEAAAISDAGHVVGSFQSASGTHAFVWQEGIATDLGTLTGGGGSSSFAAGVETFGRVVGDSRDGAIRPVMWVGGTALDLDTPSGDVSGMARGISRHGQVVGQSCCAGGRFHAALWEDDSAIHLPKLPGHLQADAYAISGTGWVVGHSNSFTTSRAVVWTVGVATNAPPLADAGQDVTEACVQGAASVTLDGSGSSDPDGDALTWTWSLGGAVIATGETATVTLPLGTHVVTLTVTDGGGESDTDEVVVSVVDRTPPEVTAALIPVPGEVQHNKGLFTVTFACADACDPGASVTTARLNGVTVEEGQVVELRPTNGNGGGRGDRGVDPPGAGGGRGRKPHVFRADSFELVVQCADGAGNVGSATAVAAFPPRPGRPG